MPMTSERRVPTLFEKKLDAARRFREQRERVARRMAEQSRQTRSEQDSSAKRLQREMELRAANRD